MMASALHLFLVEILLNRQDYNLFRLIDIQTAVWHIYQGEGFSFCCNKNNSDNRSDNSGSNVSAAAFERSGQGLRGYFGRRHGRQRH